MHHGVIYFFITLSAARHLYELKALLARFTTSFSFFILLFSPFNIESRLLL